jgi:hypothetical protein
VQCASKCNYCQDINRSYFIFYKQKNLYPKPFTRKRFQNLSYVFFTSVNKVDLFAFFNACILKILVLFPRCTAVVIHTIMQYRVPVGLRG